MVRPASLLFLLSACSPGAIAVGVPWLEVPDSITVVDVTEGQPNDIGFAVLNAGTAPANVAATTDGPPFDVAGENVAIAVSAEGLIPLSVTPVGFEDQTTVVTLSTGLDVWEVPVEITVDRDVDDDGHEDVTAGGDDCDDQDATRFPGAVETCDGVDEDCDDVVDDVAVPPTWWPDGDEDGFGDAGATGVTTCTRPPGTVANADDCDDADTSVSPNGFEVYYDGVDQDCDSLSDFDQDVDGFDSDQFAGTDCDDEDAGVSPVVVEVWYDGVDQNCDGNDLDQDGDGDPGGAAGTDCDDLDPGIGPSTAELDDGLDQNCDGHIDEGIFVRGTLVFTEVMINPVNTADNVGRYVEIYNPTDGDVDLSQVTVRVGTRNHVLVGWLAPSATVVLCSETDPALNGGVPCDSLMTWSGLVRTLVAEAVALDLDEVDWTGWVIPAGDALELGAAWVDPESNDVEGNWCPGTAVLPGGDRGTPGVVMPPC